MYFRYCPSRMPFSSSIADLCYHSCCRLSIFVLRTCFYPPVHDTISCSHLFIGEVFGLYERFLAGERVLVVISFWHFDLRWRLPEGFPAERGELLIGNYPEPKIGALRPYEAQIWRWKR